MDARLEILSHVRVALASGQSLRRSWSALPDSMRSLAEAKDLAEIFWGLERRSEPALPTIMALQQSEKLKSKIQKSLTSATSSSLAQMYAAFALTGLVFLFRMFFLPPKSLTDIGFLVLAFGLGVGLYLLIKRSLRRFDRKLWRKEWIFLLINLRNELISGRTWAHAVSKSAALIDKLPKPYRVAMSQLESETLPDTAPASVLAIARLLRERLSLTPLLADLIEAEGDRLEEEIAFETEKLRTKLVLVLYVQSLSSYALVFLGPLSKSFL